LRTPSEKPAEPKTKAGGFWLAVWLGILAAASVAYAQQSNSVPRIVLVIPSPAEAQIELTDALRQRLHDLGYVEGQSIRFEMSLYPPERPDLLPGIASELARSKADVLLAVSTPQIRALMEATKTIPIVMIAPGDPVGSGLVASLARPGGNVTGLTIMSYDIMGKRLELLKQAIPKISRVGALFNPTNPAGRRDVLEELQSAGRTLRIAIHPAPVREPSEIASAFASIVREHDGGLIVAVDPVIWPHRKLIVDLCAQNRLPSMSYFREFAALGGLMSYGPSNIELFRRAATYVDKILKGAKPSDLPVEQPTKFELVINLKTAKALGITIPEAILLGADEVIR
jgi:putative ABC transport system substrate-binding protein